MLCVSSRRFALVLNCGGGASSALSHHLNCTRCKGVNDIGSWKLFLHPFLTLCVTCLDLGSYLKESEADKTPQPPPSFVSTSSHRGTGLANQMLCQIPECFTLFGGTRCFLYQMIEALPVLIDACSCSSLPLSLSPLWFPTAAGRM